MPTTSSAPPSIPSTSWFELVLAVACAAGISITQTPAIADGTLPTASQKASPLWTVLLLQVLPAADGLGDRAVEDVGADRGHRRDPEDEDQQRRHQRRAAHAGHADEQADAEAEDDDRWIHVQLRAGVGGRDALRPPGLRTFVDRLARSARKGSERPGHGSQRSAFDPGLRVVEDRVDAPRQLARWRTSASVMLSSTTRRLARTATQTSRRRSAGPRVVEVLRRGLVDVGERALDRPDHVRDGDVLGRAGEPVAALVPRLARHQARVLELEQDVLEELQRDVLCLGELLALDRLAVGRRPPAPGRRARRSRLWRRSSSARLGDRVAAGIAPRMAADDRPAVTLDGIRRPARARRRRPLRRPRPA